MSASAAVLPPLSSVGRCLFVLKAETWIKPTCNLLSSESTSKLYKWQCRSCKFNRRRLGHSLLSDPSLNISSLQNQLQLRIRINSCSLRYKYQLYTIGFISQRSPLRNLLKNPPKPPSHWIIGADGVIDNDKNLLPAWFSGLRLFPLEQQQSSRSVKSRTKSLPLLLNHCLVVIKKKSPAEEDCTFAIDSTDLFVLICSLWVLRIIWMNLNIQMSPLLAGSAQIALQSDVRPSPWINNFNFNLLSVPKAFPSAGLEYILEVMQIFRATADLDRCVELVRSSKNRVASKVNVFYIERRRALLHVMSCNMMIGFCVTAYTCAEMLYGSRWERKWSSYLITGPSITALQRLNIQSHNWTYST